MAPVSCTRAFEPDRPIGALHLALATGLQRGHVPRLVGRADHVRLTLPLSRDYLHLDTRCLTSHLTQRGYTCYGFDALPLRCRMRQAGLAWHFVIFTPGVARWRAGEPAPFFRKCLQLHQKLAGHLVLGYVVLACQASASKACGWRQGTMLSPHGRQAYEPCSSSTLSSSMLLQVKVNVTETTLVQLMCGSLRCHTGVTQATYGHLHAPETY